MDARHHTQRAHRKLQLVHERARTHLPIQEWPAILVKRQELQDQLQRRHTQYSCLHWRDYARLLRGLHRRVCRRGTVRSRRLLLRQMLEEEGQAELYRESRGFCEGCCQELILLRVHGVWDSGILEMGLWIDTRHFLTICRLAI